MPTDSNGVYSLPAGYLAVTGQTIQASQHNPPLEDVAAALSGRLPRNGAAPMTAPLKLSDGTVLAPSLAFNTAAGAGLYKTASGIGVALGGAKVAEFGADGVIVGAATPAQITTLQNNIDALTAALRGYLIEPQGRLTLTSGVPVLVTGVTAASSVYYAPYCGDKVPIWDSASSAFVLRSFTQKILTLNSNHLANTLYDVFAFWSGSDLVIGIGPAWNNSSVGASERGSGSGTTEIERKLGLWTNKVEISLRNGASTTTVAANSATYLGTLLIDASAGQVSHTTAYGQNRICGIWNAYNRKRTVLLCGDGTASWTYAINGWRAANSASSNSIKIICGLPEEWIDAEFIQRIDDNTGSGGTSLADIGISLNGGASPTGFQGRIGSSSATFGVGGYAVNSARLLTPPALGLTTLTAFENGNGSGNAPRFYGTQSFMQLSAGYLA